VLNPHADGGPILFCRETDLPELDFGGHRWTWAGNEGLQMEPCLGLPRQEAAASISPTEIREWDVIEDPLCLAKVVAHGSRVSEGRPPGVAISARGASLWSWLFQEGVDGGEQRILLAARQLVDLLQPP
jgi:hypothetical protein